MRSPRRYMNTLMDNKKRPPRLDRTYRYGKFQLELKISPALFYLKTRLRYADYLLRSSSKPMTQVSAEAGFSYFSHFSRAYKANYGTSPKEARNGKQHAIQD